MCNAANLFQTILAQMNCPGAFTQSIGVTITQVAPQEAWGELSPSDTHRNPLGTIHGGAICTLMDAVGGAAGASSGYGCATVDCNIHFIRPCQATQRLYCRARAIKPRGRLQIFDMSVTTESGALIAKGTYTYQLLNRIESEESL